MPRRPAPTVCVQPGCPNLTTTGRRCDQHTRHQPDYRPSAWQRGYDADHRERRKHTPKTPCVDCGEPWQPGYHLDHADGNATNNHPDNLVWRCHPDHSRKTIRHDGGFGKPKPHRQ